MIPCPGFPTISPFPFESGLCTASETKACAWAGKESLLSTNKNSHNLQLKHHLLPHEIVLTERALRFVPGGLRLTVIVSLEISSAPKFVSMQLEICLGV